MMTLASRRQLIVAALLLAIPAAALPQASIEEELDAAKELYSDGRLDEAIGALRGVIVKLNELRSGQNRTLQLADAHFHLGLAYLAMRDESTAIENFRQVVALDPDRLLDPDIYAPRVVSVFERARSDVVRASPSGPSQAPADRGTPQPVASRTPEDPLLRILPGTKLRVARTGVPSVVEGQLLALDADVLTIGTADWRLDLSRGMLQRVEVVIARKNHWIAGMLVGAAFGVVIGALETPGCGGNDGDCYTRGENMGYGGLGAGLVGGLIGALYRTDVWAELPLDGAARITSASDGLAISYSWRY